MKRPFFPFYLFPAGTHLIRAWGLVALLAMPVLSAIPLVSLDYRINGLSLQVTPAVLSVPKGIAGSVLISVVAGGSTNNEAVAKLSAGAYVQAVIRGPGFPTPQRIVGAPNAPLLLPAINLVGDYELDGISLVDSVTGETRLEGLPSSVPVHVFDQILISSVTSKPLTLDEIQQRGIDIDESNFRAVEFNVSFVVDGQTIPVAFPVISPKFTDSTELIPAAEVEARLKQATALNQQIASTVVQLPPELQTASLNIQIQGLNFQVADPGAPASLGLNIPPIPALMVIPGNIGYLHQFFSVKIFTENGAPLSSGLSVDNVMAHLDLPPGPDGIVSTNYAQPGDDPLRFARIGPNKIIKADLQVADPGPDGLLGTADDITRLQPGETGQAEFLVEGLQQGLAIMNLSLTADLYGLPAGKVSVKGKAAGSVLVRNPSFSLTFTHPNTVRVGEPYTASITVLNTGVTPANLVSVSLNRNSISGAILAPGQLETVQLNTVLPGQTATATYHLISQRTGQITFSDLTTSDNSVQGRFRFTMGVDAQGVPLSPDTIAMPDYVNYLPSNVVAAATRVLGQALSIATAAQLPAGIVSIRNPIITRRVLDLAEAGQRVHYGDPLVRVLADLLRDWQGGRVTDDGFDSLLRTSDAGQDWQTAMITSMETTDGLTGTTRLLNRAPDLTGLGQEFVLGSAGPGQMRVDFTGTTNSATPTGSSQPYSMIYTGTNGNWALTPFQTNAIFTWTFTNRPVLADMTVLIVHSNGQAQQLRWQVPNPPSNAVYTYALGGAPSQLLGDTNGDGSVDIALNPTQSTVNELAPALVAVQQDLTVVAGRPPNPCVGPDNLFNYGTVVAVVFSKPMTQAFAGATNSYIVEGNNGANSVQIQPSSRVALINLRKGISAIKPRKLTVAGITDVRGNALVAAPVLIQTFTPGTTNSFTEGVAVVGRVLRGDGTVAAGIPVTLTMYDGVALPNSCAQWIRRVSQVITDSGGNFDFDYVMSGIPYSISASDTGTLPPGALQLVMSSTLTDKADSQELQQQISAAANPNSLLALLSAGSLPQAVAIVEGLDRASIHDVVGIGSGREGQTVPFALRFRGRATVIGTVVAQDGVTPVPNAAVNLFPDPSSSELGRGVFSDGTGQFAFAGVPLGVFSVQVATSDHRTAAVLGIVDTPGETTNILISLPTNVVAFATLRGQVFDSDNLTPVGNARVFVGHYDSSANTVRGVIALANADASGIWEATNVPIQNLDIVALTFDGTRKGVRLGINPTANSVTYANITLQSATTVFGKVTFDDGRPATNALVAGGVALVRTDVNGNFQLQGVPVGYANISAGLEKNPAAGIAFTRLGSASANIVAGAANYVVIKLRPAARIFGKVFDAQGHAKGGIRVSIPQEGGFYYTDADANGNYVFDNIGLGSYIVSAPANAVAPQLNQSKLMDQISSGDEDQILAAFNEAISVFVGANDPLITGDQLKFRPSSWGYTHANVSFDGANVNADITFIVQGTVSGKVLNAQGVPIGAAVRLTGIGPDVTGNPVTTIRGDGLSDPATGTFGFTNVLLAGPFGLQAASPFYPVVIQTNGFTTSIDPDARGIVMQFPPVNDVNGRIAGHVFNPDGTLVGQGAHVHIDVSADYQIQTDTNGFFDTQTEFPANRGYTVEVFDPASGLKGRAGLAMTPGVTNIVDVHLLSKDSTVNVLVLRASGQPAIGAQVELDQGTYPNDAAIFGITDTNGMVSFPNLWEGMYSASAQYTEQSTRLFSRGGVTVAANDSGLITLRLGGTGTLIGTFVKQDHTTPVYGAQVSIGNLGFSTTDTNGFFRFDGVPLGTYQIVSFDPVTGASAQNSTTLSYNAQTQTVQLVEATLGTVSGFVLDPYNNGFVPNVSVMIYFTDGLTPSRAVTTGPNGGFLFPASPPGAFFLNARYALPGAVNLTLTGQASGSLSEVNTSVSVSIQLQPLTRMTVQVFRPDGITAAFNTTVTVNDRVQDTSTNGQAFFGDLFVPAYYTVTAVSHVGGEVYSGVQSNITLNTHTTNAAITLILPGVGNVSGTVVASDGTTPVANAQITLQFLAPLFSGTEVTSLSDAQGRFAFNDIPLGAFRVSAASQSLAASANGTLAISGQTNVISLRLGNSGSLLGVVVRADGVTPVPGVDVALDFTSQSLNAGHAVFHTGTNGAFRFDNLPVSPIHVSAADPDFGGIINFNTALTFNGQVRNLGAVPFDEDVPFVVSVNPPDATLEVPITNGVDILFNEALDTNTISASGIFLRGTNGNVSSVVTLLPHTNGVLRVVHVQPVAPLRSKNVYELIVLSGDLPGPTGGIIGSGPRDLVGRALAAPFSSRFATADNTPPQLVSIFPSNNAVQIDPSAVPRVSFDKTLRSTGFVFQVFGPGGPVAGTAGLGVNGQVISFVPTSFLQPNAFYSIVVSNVFDQAGNRSAGEPFRASFATLDTLGPVIASVQIASNTVPAAGATVPMIATLVTNEPGVSVRFTQDFNPVGTATNLPYTVMVKLPSTGSTTIRAIATDQYGNDGQFAQAVITVQVPQPPTIQFTLVSPTNGPLPTGSQVIVDVHASGDTAITNLSAVVSGAGSGAYATTNGSTIRVQGVVSNTAFVGQQVQVLARAFDTLGLSSGQQIFSLPVSDATPPSLSFLVPANNAHLGADPSFDFFYIASDNSTNLNVTLQVAGAFTYTQATSFSLLPNVPATNSFTVPLSNAPANGGLITATLTATDAASNSFSSSRNFWLPGTVGPSIAALAIVSNLPPISGATVPVRASLAVAQSGASVRFTQDGNPIGVITNSPFDIQVVLPNSGTTTVRAIATDQFGFDGPVAVLTITVHPNVPPTLQLVRVTPTSGSLRSGANFEVDAAVSGNPGTFHITATLSGATALQPLSTDGTNLIILAAVPSSATSGQQVQISAQAVDGLSQTSALQTISIPIVDSTPPSIAFLGPPENYQLDPNQPLNISVSGLDNSSNVNLQLTLNGSVAITQSVQLAISANQVFTNVFSVTITNQPANGSPITAQVTAQDQAGNSAIASRIFWLPGARTTVLWNRQAFGQTFSCTNGHPGYSWPNNNNWSQSALFGDPCGIGTNVLVAPSNWSSTNYPNDSILDVVLGGLGGASVNLDTAVNLHSLTIQPPGSLSMYSPGAGSSISAVNFFFQGDGVLGRTACCGAVTLSLNGGTMAKTDGTNVFAIDPGIILTSQNGTFAVNSGILDLPGNNSYYTNGTFNAASNAILELVPAGNNVTFSGTFHGSGPGSVLFDGGSLSSGSGGATFNLPAGLFQWAGGTFVGGISNVGFMDIAGFTDSVLANQSHYYNAGNLVQQGSANLGLSGSGGGLTTVENLSTGVYQFLGDESIISRNCCGDLRFNNQGLLLKSGGTNVSSISIPFYNMGGVIQVDIGTLRLDAGGSSSGGNFKVAQNAILDLTGGANPSWQGLLTGSGLGKVSFNSGTIGAGGLTLAFTNDLFQWSGGIFAGSITNTGIVDLTGSGSRVLGNQSHFYNLGIVKHLESGAFGFNGSGGGVTSFENLPGGTYNLSADSVINLNNCCGTLAFNNQGLFLKTVSTGTSEVSIAFNNLGGTVEVDTGRLLLAGAGSSSNGFFVVKSGALLDLTGGSAPVWQGRWQGMGSGELLFGDGNLWCSPSLTLAFTNDLFQWRGGIFYGALTNLGIIDFSGTPGGVIGNQSHLYNAGIFKHLSSGTLGFNGSGGGVTSFENLPNGIYDFQTNGNIALNNCCGTLQFNNRGKILKSGGSGAANISITMNNSDGVLQVDQGQLVFSGGGTSSNGLFVVAPGSLVDLTGGNSPVWQGRMTETGGGQVGVLSGQLNGSYLNLAFTNNSFQWSGGILAGIFTNVGIVNLPGNGVAVLANQSIFYNVGTVNHSGNGALGMNGSGGGVTAFRNLPGAIYEFTGGGVVNLNNCCGTLNFDNFGLVWKTGATNTSTISTSFNNQNGTIKVDQGQLVLNGGGASFGGYFDIAAGASVDVTGGSSPQWSGLAAGTGGGNVFFSSGNIIANSGLSLNFAPNVFQWGGGIFYGNITNFNSVTVSGFLASAIGNQSHFYNAGTVIHSGAGPLGLNGSGGGITSFENLANGVYRFQNDSSVLLNNCCGTLQFNNSGLIWKSSGSGNSTISVDFNNQDGSIQVDSGSLKITQGNYLQGQGTFTVKLGGTNAGQFGSMSVSGNAVLGGPLNVYLTNGYVPAIGDQFQIISSANLSGAFSTVLVPSGFAVTNIGANVYLRYTGTGPVVVSRSPSVGVSIPSPGLLLFSGASNSTWQVWSSTNLTGSNWVLLGQITITNSAQNWRDPYVTPARQRYYRVVRLQ